jgi:hypothetical protein
MNDRATRAIGRFERVGRENRCLIQSRHPVSQGLAPPIRRHEPVALREPVAAFLPAFLRVDDHGVEALVVQSKDAIAHKDNGLNLAMVGSHRRAEGNGFGLGEMEEGHQVDVGSLLDGDEGVEVRWLVALGAVLLRGCADAPEGLVQLSTSELRERLAWARA